MGTRHEGSMPRAVRRASDGGRRVLGRAGRDRRRARPGPRRHRPGPSSSGRGRARDRLGDGPPPVQPAAQPLGGLAARRAARRPGPRDRLRPRPGDRGTGPRRRRPRVRRRPFRRDAPAGVQAQRRRHPGRPGHPDQAPRPISFRPLSTAPSTPSSPSTPSGSGPRRPSGWPSCAGGSHPAGASPSCPSPAAPGPRRARPAGPPPRSRTCCAGAGFTQLSTETLPLSPPVVCVLATRA